MISSGCKDTRITKIEFVAKTPLGKNRNQFFFINIKTKIKKNLGFMAFAWLNFSLPIHFCFASIKYYAKVM